MREVTFYRNQEDGTVLLDISISSAYVRLVGLERVQENRDRELGEKHKIMVENQGGMLLVRVGSPLHDTHPEHYIEWIFVQTENGGMYTHLYPGDSPKAEFKVEADNVKGIYAYCNDHGLFKA